MSSGILLCPLTRSSLGRRPADTAPALRFATDHAQVLEEARRRSIDLTALPTQDACRLIINLDRGEVYSVLQITC
jgi:hypothetical protein